MTTHAGDPDRCEDFAKVVRDCDAVFDTVGGDVAQKSFAVLKPGGNLEQVINLAVSNGSSPSFSRCYQDK
jgi:NADPH:quinone reductase-like Zn-dependent oxidoreductase